MSDHSLSLREAKTGTLVEPLKGSSSSYLISISCSADFLHIPGPPDHSGLGPPTSAINQECPTDLLTVQAIPQLRPPLPRWLQLVSGWQKQHNIPLGCPGKPKCPLCTFPYPLKTSMTSNDSLGSLPIKEAKASGSVAPDASLGIVWATSQVVHPEWQQIL